MASIVRNARGSNQDAPIVWVPIDVSQTIEQGDLVQIDGTSRKGELAVAASTTIVGIAQSPITTGVSVTADDQIPVSLVRGMVIRLAVDQTGSKKTFDATDKYTTAYDLKDELSVNPDDTTGGMCYVQDYDNTAHTVDVIIADANLANVG